LSIDINKRKVFDWYFQAVRDKLGTKKAMQYKGLLCYFAGMANFGAAGKREEGGVSTGSLRRATKRHFCVRGASGIERTERVRVASRTTRCH
jgi:hypothetical protein